MSRKLAVLLGITVLFVNAVNADEYPTRKPGLWEIKMTSSTAQGRPSPVMKQCIDAATDQKMFEMGKGMAGNAGMNCQKNEFRKEGSSWISESVCSLGPTQLSSKGVFTGDFNSSYHAQIDSSYNPPMMGMSTMTLVMDATYKGACLSDQKPGDVILPDGKKMNVLTLMNSAPGGVH